MKYKYSNELIKALRTLATPSQFILHIDDLKPGSVVVLYGRASTRQQKENLPHQMFKLKAEMEKRGLIVIGAFSEFAHGDDEYRRQFERAVATAQAHGAVIVAETKTRFLRRFKITDEDGRRLPSNTRGELRPLTVFDMREFFQTIPDGVQLVTVNHPDAEEEDDRSYETKRGQEGTGKRGGRPVEQCPKKAKRLRLMPKVIELWKSGLSYREIDRTLRLPWSTVRDWIKRWQKSAHPLQQAEQSKVL